MMTFIGESHPSKFIIIIIDLLMIYKYTCIFCLNIYEYVDNCILCYKIYVYQYMFIIKTNDNDVIILLLIVIPINTFTQKY